MKRILFLAMICIPLFVMAQTDAKYLEGAVPLIEGKVTFTNEIRIPGMNQEQIYGTILKWANQRYQPEEKLTASVLYANQEEGNIVAGGDEYLVFSSSAFSLDKTRIYYHLTLKASDERCDISMTRIRYWYEENRDGGEKFTAEERITDKAALNKNKTKLYPIVGKFRKGTVDFKDKLFKEIQSALNDEMIALGLTITTVSKQEPPQETAPSMPAPKKDMPAQTVQELDTETCIRQANRMVLTVGNDKQIELGKESWGGFSELLGKRITYCLIDTQKTQENMLMLQGNQYTISFYLPESQEPCTVIRCKKMMQESINGEEAKKLSPEAQANKSYNVYIGEILK